MSNRPPIDQVKVTSGYVACFDILGYGELTNGGENLPVVINLFQQIKSAIKRVQENNDSQLSSHVVFGDCIFLFFEGTAEQLHFSVAPICRGIFDKTFQEGIPLRGAIARVRGAIVHVRGAIARLSVAFALGPIRKSESADLFELRGVLAE